MKFFQHQQIFAYNLEAENVEHALVIKSFVGKNFDDLTVTRKSLGLNALCLGKTFGNDPLTAVYKRSKQREKWLFMPYLRV